jgi:hypothetical protein
MHEYQNKGDRKWAICKQLILKGAFIFVQNEKGAMREQRPDRVGVNFPRST